MNIDPNVARLAASALGVAPPGGAPAGAAPQGAPQAAPQGMPQGAPAAAAPAAPEKDTAQEKAATAGSPTTEADKMTDDAVVYEIEFGPEDKRKLSPQQIKSTFERYSALNYEHANMKPIVDLSKLIAEKTGAGPKEVAQFLINAAKAQLSQPQFGAAADRNQPQGDGTSPTNRAPQQGGTTNGGQQGSIDELAAWESENAAKLPPGYKDMLGGMKQLQQQNQQLQQMLMQVMGGVQGAAGAAQQFAQQARSREASAVQQSIQNNLTAAQQALQLPDDKAQDFMMFAYERGYTMEDFVSPELTLRVAQDFKNASNTPEMERLMSMAKRRQSFTGGIGAGPAAQGAPGGAPSGNDPLARLTNRAMSKR